MSKDNLLLDKIWSHPLNKGVPQKNIQHFNTVKTYLDSIPKDVNGNNVIDGKELESILNSFNKGAVENPKEVFCEKNYISNPK